MRWLSESTMTAPYIQTFEGVFAVPAVSQDSVKPIFQIYASTDAPGGALDNIKLVPRILEIEIQLLSNAAAELYIYPTLATGKGAPVAWIPFPYVTKIGGIYQRTNPTFTNCSECPIASGFATKVDGSVPLIFQDYAANPTPNVGYPLRRISLPAGIGNNQIICFPNEGDGSIGFHGSSAPGGSNNLGPGMQIWAGPGSGGPAVLNAAMMMRVRWQEVPVSGMDT